MQLRDYLLTTVGIFDMAVGGYMAAEPAAAGTWAGWVFVALAGLLFVIIYLPLAHEGILRAIDGVFDKYPFLTRYRDWQLFKPVIRCPHDLNVTNTYHEKTTNVENIGIYFNLSIENRYPVGEIEVDWSKSSLLLKQKSGDYKYTFDLIPKSKAKKTLRTSEVGLPFQLPLDFIWQVTDQNRVGAPDLAKMGKWRIDGITVNFYGPVSFQKRLKAIKGTLWGGR